MSSRAFFRSRRNQLEVVAEHPESRRDSGRGGVMALLKVPGTNKGGRLGHVLGPALLGIAGLVNLAWIAFLIWLVFFHWV
jgi:hypothetical protein